MQTSLSRVIFSSDCVPQKTTSCSIKVENKAETTPDKVNFLIYYIYFESTCDAYNLISSQQCDLFMNCIFLL